MTSPPIPANEAARLAALRNYRILDTSPEEAFDRITRLASQTLAFPIALVSLVDETRQWFKSRVGLDVSQTPREDAFCAFTINGTEILEVSDTHQDPRFSNNPLVLGPPYIRSYAGAPLVTPDGSIGTLCVIDREPRTLTPQSRQILVDLAAMVRDALEMRIAIAKTAAVQAELERSNQDLDQFAYLTSHDLQEPLRTVANLSEFLARRYREQLDDEGLTSVRRVSDAVERMQQLIGDVLQHSRLGRSVQMQTIELRSLLDAVLQDMSVTIAEHEARINIGPMPTLVGRASEIRLLFQNLIGNALKFKKADVSPQVDISAEEQAKEWRFAVTDNGIGIDPSEFRRIFYIFQRLHPRTQYKGTGIGLAHCRRIVETHGGKIWVESLPNQGSTFFFTLAKSTPDEP